MTDKPTKTAPSKASGKTPCHVDFVEQCTITWFNLDEVAPPPQAHDELYGARYSVPVLIANAVTGQVEQRTVVYDYEDGGWCLFGLPDGPSCYDYELMLPTHYCTLPCFAI